MGEAGRPWWSGTGSCISLVTLSLVALALVVAGVGVTAATGTTVETSAQTGTLTVDDDGGGDYESIQAAIDDATAGDVIRVRAGTYDGFEVDKNVTITTEGAVIEETVQILGAAAPVIEGFTIQPAPLESDDATPFGVAAPDTSGDWVLRNVTVRTVPEGPRPVFTRNSVGDWRIENSVLEDYVEARNTAGRWRITNTIVQAEVVADGSTGNWAIRESLIDGRSAFFDDGVSASNTSGGWLIEDSAVLANVTEFPEHSVIVPGSSGPWTIRGSYLNSRVIASANSGDWTVRESYIGPADAGPNNPFKSVDVSQTSGAWLLTDSTVEGALGLNTEYETIDGEPVDPETNRRGEATQVYWGQPGGPWDNTDRDGYGTFAKQCPDEVTCTDSLGSPPSAVPSREIVADLGPERSLLVDDDGTADYESIQPAIDDASPGNTIRVRAGEYNGFSVGKDVQIVTPGAAVDGGVQITGDAAPVIEGFTIRNHRVDASGSAGDWILRDVRVTVDPSDENAVDALDSTGNWRVIDSNVTGVQAGRATGGWAVIGSTITSDLKAIETTGDWTLRDSVVGSEADPRTIRVVAAETDGDWTIQDSAIVGADTEAVLASSGTGAWQIIGSYLSATLAASNTAGDWTVRDSYIRPSTAFGNGDSVNAGGTVGAWTITGSVLPGTLSAFNADPTGDATGNFWGQSSGPREGQCEGNVNCGDWLSSPTVSLPPLVGDRIDIGGSQNQPPTAVVSTNRPRTDGRLLVGVGQTVQFNASNSRDPDGEIRSYEWTIDGPTPDTGTGQLLTRTFIQPGTYELNLTVSDGIASDSTTLTVDVRQSVDGPGGLPDNLPPVARITGPDETATPGESVSFSAAESADLDSQFVSEYRWDLDGDGATDQRTNDPTVRTNYEDPGAYDVSVTVVDTGGATDSATTTLRVDAENRLPAAALSAQPNEGERFTAGLPITFDASESIVPDGRIVAYEYDFGDGTTRRVDADTGGGRTAPGRSRGLSPRTTYSYERPGEYTATVTVIDSKGRRAEASLPITVESSEAVQITATRSVIPGPMIDGADIRNNYTIGVTGSEPIESVTVEFPTGETREAVKSELFSTGEFETWVLQTVDIDAVTQPGTNVVEVRATDEQGRTTVDTFSIEVFDPPGWFDFAMGTNPTQTRNDQGQWALRSDAPTIPAGGLVGPSFQFTVPVSEISGDYDIGLGANYGFEYVFETREATAGGSGRISFSTPRPGLDLEADIGPGFEGSRSRGFSGEISGTARITENGDRVRFERGRVAFGTEASATVPIAGVAVYIPKVDTTIGVANVDLTLTKGFEPAAELTVNDARTALVPSGIGLTQTIDVKVTAGAGGSIGAGGVRAGLEVRGIAGADAEFTTDVYPELGVDQITVGLRAGVRACLGPCGTEWLLNDEYLLVESEQSAARVGPTLRGPNRP